ncbi:MAG: septal ring lytic transglycosylase RlpA family protein [Chthoniobacterales bacterium]
MALCACLCLSTGTAFATTKKKHTKSSSSHHSSHSSSSHHSTVKHGIRDMSNPPVLYMVQPGYTDTGIASWYGGRDVGRKTANGETYRPTDVTAAHKRLPFNTLVRVTNLANNVSIIVRINDRGPYIRGRMIDLSEISAKKIGVYEHGLSKVKIEVVKSVPLMTQPNLRVNTSGDHPTKSHSH